MSAKAKDKVKGAGTSVLTTGRLLPGSRLSRARNAFSLVLFVSACAVWLASINRLGVSQEGLPWYVTIGIIAAFSVRFFRADEYSFSFSGLPVAPEPLKLPESIAICFLFTALSLYVWVGWGLLLPRPEPSKIVQIVDIQLLSGADFQNNRVLVPGTRTAPDLRKRSADQVSQHGAINSPRVQTSKENLTCEKPNIKAGVKGKQKKPSEKPDAGEQGSRTGAVPSPESDMMPVIMPSGWQTRTLDTHYQPVRKNLSSGAQTAPEGEPYLSEVAPPELVELMENDGARDAMHVFQKGGRSSDGSGAENSLSLFLKELHKRIRNSWSPPRGFAASTAVTFRLKKDGQLAFLKITRTSGKPEIDKSAAKAIMSAVTSGHGLPRDFQPNFLDIIYTFNYNVDELQELTSGRQP